MRQPFLRLRHGGGLPHGHLAWCHACSCRLFTLLLHHSDTRLDLAQTLFKFLVALLQRRFQGGNLIVLLLLHCLDFGERHHRHHNASDTAKREHTHHQQVWSAVVGRGGRLCHFLDLWHGGSEAVGGVVGIVDAALQTLFGAGRIKVHSILRPNRHRCK